VLSYQNLGTVRNKGIEANVEARLLRSLNAFANYTYQARPVPKDFDISKIVFPNPPAIARIKYLNFFIGEKIEHDVKTSKPKTGWMDRLAGTQPLDERKDLKIPFQLISPNGLAVDSKGLVYAGDYRVGAVFIIDMETKQAQLIKNKIDANFKLINGLAIDDNDRLFVAEGNAAAAVAGSDAWAGLGTHLDEGAVASIAKEDAGSA